jgi:hypothetical protein
MDTIYKSSNKIHEMYKDLSYFDQYGTSVFIFIILIVVLFCIASYFYVLKNIQPIKDDWVNQRCKPTVMPFAGIINPPEGTTASDFTNQNFSYCMQNILTAITGFAVEPITYATSMLTSIYNELAQAINTIKTMMSSIRTNISSISQEIMGRILNITTPLIQIIISIVDSLNKTIGILTAGLYTSLGTYYTLKSLMGAILQFVIIILILNAVSNSAVISLIFKIAGYTYGPLLGLFLFGLFTDLKIRDRFALHVCLVAPVLTFCFEYASKTWAGFDAGFLTILINGGFTTLGLWLIAYRNQLS